MTKIIHRRTALAIGIAAGALTAPILASRGQAQGTDPSSSMLRIVVPFAVGGTTDLLARVVAQILVQSMASSFVIDNRTGGAGNVSAETVARAPPDGMTL